MSHYLSKLIVNITLLTFYAFQVFNQHQPCLSGTSKNITDQFELAFLLGFIVVIVDFVNSGMLTVYFRFKIEKDMRQFGQTGIFTKWMAEITSYIDITTRVFTLFLCIHQLIVLYSKTGDYCVKD